LWRPHRLECHPTSGANQQDEQHDDGYRSNALLEGT